MISAVHGATTRHSHGLLIGGAIGAAAEAAWVASAPYSVAPLVAFLATASALLVLAGASFRLRRPAAFAVRERSDAFTALPRAGNVYFALLALLFLGFRVGAVLGAARAGRPWRWDLYLGVLVLVLVIVAVVPAWRGYDVALRSDGLYDRRGFGTLIVPWQAIPQATVDTGRTPTGPVTVWPPGAFPAEGSTGGTARPATVRLEYSRHELVRRRGLVLSTKKLVTEQLDAPFLAAAINFYAANPHHREEIGTEHGYRHLSRAITPGSA
jgi:hypothetical protein